MNTISKSVVAFLVSAFLVSTFAFAEGKKDIVDVAIENGNFNTLVNAVKAAGLEETLKGEGPYTIFAPTDEAFAKIPAETLNALIENKDELAKILSYHVLAGKAMAKDVSNLSSAKTVQGQDVALKVDNGKVYIDDAQVIITDIQASNGVIHVIDSVIMPE